MHLPQQFMIYQKEQKKIHLEKKMLKKIPVLMALMDIQKKLLKII